MENPGNYLGSTARTVITPGPPVSPEGRVKASRYVAAQATDAADCRLLLDMLGLLPDELCQPKGKRPRSNRI